MSSDTSYPTMKVEDWEEFWDWFTRAFRSRTLSEIVDIFPPMKHYPEFTTLELILKGWKLARGFHTSPTTKIEADKE